MIIGVDGANSLIRDLSNIKSKDKGIKKYGLVGLIEHDQTYPFTSWQVFSENGILALLAKQNITKTRSVSSMIWSLDKNQMKFLLNLDKDDFEKQIKNEIGLNLGKLSMINNSIILRYLIKENIFSFLIIFSFSCLLFISIDLIELIRRSSSKEIDFFILLKMAIFHIPTLFPLILPTVFLLSSMHTYMKLNKNSELTVLRASGFSIVPPLIFEESESITIFNGFFVIT